MRKWGQKCLFFPRKRKGKEEEEEDLANYAAFMFLLEREISLECFVSFFFPAKKGGENTGSRFSPNWKSPDFLRKYTSSREKCILLLFLCVFHESRNFFPMYDFYLGSSSFPSLNGAAPKPIHGINPDNYLRSADLCEPVARRETDREKEGNKGFPMYAHIYPTQKRRGRNLGLRSEITVEFLQSENSTAFSTCNP